MPDDDERVFGHRARWAVLTACVAFGVAATVGSVAVPDGKPAYVMVHAVTALPFQLASIACSHLAVRRAPVDHRVFWRRWRAANVVSAVTSPAAIAAITLDVPALLVVDVAAMVVSAPLWMSATVAMVKLHAGRLSPSIDLVDGATVLAVLGLPAALVVAGPLARSDELLFAVPFAVIAVLAPAGLYLTVVELMRVPHGRRTSQAVGLALMIAFLLAMVLQLSRVVTSVELPLPTYVGLHMLVMTLLVAVPVTAYRTLAEVAAGAPGGGQVRHASPIPALAAVGLPVVGTFVFLTEDDRPWAVPAFAAVAVAVVALNAVRYAALTREAHRLHAGLAAMAEERRHLVASMLHALDDDRQRTATELHTQAVGSLATLASVMQTAAVSLPPDSAVAVKETLARLQGDLGDRAEDLRRLMVAMRSPAFGTGEGAPGTDATLAGGESALGAALRAYASELVGDRETPVVSVHVDPTLRLGWATTAIAYRIAREAVLDATRQAGATAVDVRVVADDGEVVVDVCDDGTVAHGRPDGEATMALFTQLGRGELSVEPLPGGGRRVRSRLGVRTRPAPATAAAATASGPGQGAPAPGTPRHLRLVPPTA
jgi:signal transduction histidine kinase